MIKERKINLACGGNRVEGYFGIDAIKTDAVDATVDLEKYPWPIESEYVEEAVCFHYIEHINHDSTMKVVIETLNESLSFEDFRKDLLRKLSGSFTSNNLFMPSDGLFKFMDEVYRILVPAGKIRIITPYYSSVRAIQDPTHTRSIGEWTFMYFNKEWRKTNVLDHYGVSCDFDFQYGYNWQPDYQTKHEDQKNYAAIHLINVINDVDVTLTKRV